MWAAEKRTIANLPEVTDDQRQYYGFDIDAFGTPPPGGRVMMPLSYP
ncbi:MAG TPA: hypothetical protein VIJ23_00185 [Mycobacterium sp.]